MCRASGAVTSAGARVGGFVGERAGAGIEDAPEGGRAIVDSSATGNVTANGLLVGGFAGVSNGSIWRSFATGNVKGARFVGGFIGRSRANITQSYASGTVEGTSTDGSLGGFVGDFGGSSTKIEDSYAIGDVVAPVGVEAVGGFVGYAGSDITNSYALGSIPATDDPAKDQMGGFAGGKFGSIVGSIALASPFIGDDQGGPAGEVGSRTLAEMQNILTFTTAPANWDIAAGRTGAIWGICSPSVATINGGAPFLNWQFNADPCSPALPPVIASSSPIANGAANPSVVVTTTSMFAGGVVVGDLTIAVGGTGLTGPKLVRNSINQVTVAFTGTASAGEVSITASTAAFVPVASEASNTLTITVPEAPPSSFTVTFDANGGSGLMAAQSASVATALMANAFTRAGFTFAGWNTAADGSGTAYANGASFPFTANATLFAQWTAVSPDPGPTPPGPGPAPGPAPDAGPSPSPSVTPSLDPIGNAENSNIPSGGTPLGSAVLLVNGVPETVTVSPNTRVDPTGLDVRGTGFEVELVGVAPDGRPLRLEQTASGQQVLVLEQDGSARTLGTGFQPGSSVFVWLFSQPRLLGTVAVDSSGRFSGSVPIPSDIAVGTHMLQMNGFTAGGVVRSLSLGVEVKAAPSPPMSKPGMATAKQTVYFALYSAKLDAKAKAALNSLVKGRKKAVTRAVVNGFVEGDPRTSPNRALALARARNVAAYLKSRGVTGRFVVKASGIATGKGAERRKVVVRIQFRK